MDGHMADSNLDQAGLHQLLIEARPRLHRFCARMVGSAIDGEDVVQEAMAKAIEALPGAGRIERPESWLFRIAHNAAMDELRRRKRRGPPMSDVDAADVADPLAAADSRVAAAASLASFLRLPAAPRACVVLGDVLGYSLAEIADIAGLSLAAVKAALHRARVRMKEMAGETDEPVPVATAAERARLQAYVDRFNARDFDALRDLLAEDVRLDLVNRVRIAGRKEVSVYFSRYGEKSDWRFSVGIVEGRLALVSRDPEDAGGDIKHIVLLDWVGGKIAAIRDFKYAPYVMDGLAVGE
jgi:RNA polymerase sigma-70 factor (ECF subfamily)